MTRRIIITLVLLITPLVLGLIFTYELVKVDFTSFMEDQPGVSYQEKASIQAPVGAVPVGGKSVYVTRGVPTNPIPADEVSLQRGAVLYNINCALCHGDTGQGDGPIGEKFEKPKPANLTGTRVTSLQDGEVYLEISRGFGTMPPMSENLTARERWDVVNYVRQLSASASQ
ncbi:MAG: cytochrome c [Chloroflexi bacterium]|nr:cytochrome c [Chloroflexota bacterium]